MIDKLGPFSLLALLEVADGQICEGLGGDGTGIRSFQSKAPARCGERALPWARRICFSCDFSVSGQFLAAAGGRFTYLPLYL